MTVTNEIDEIIGILEAKLPANPANPENIKLADKLEKELRIYFQQLENAFPVETTEKIYYKYVKQE